MTFEEIEDAWVRADGKYDLFKKYLGDKESSAVCNTPVHHGSTLHDAQAMLENAGYTVLPPKKELSEKQVWYIDFIQRLLKAQNMDQRSALLEELRNKEFDD